MAYGYAPRSALQRLIRSGEAGFKTASAGDVAGQPGKTPIELYGMPGHLFRRMHQASQTIFDTEIAAAGFDLTSVQFAALAMIAEHPGLDQATLATLIAFDRATTGGVIDRLEIKGLVSREVSKSDRRARRLHLEPGGQRVLDGVLPHVRRAQNVMLKGLDAPERALLLRLLHKALEAVGDLSRPSTRTLPTARKGKAASRAS